MQGLLKLPVLKMLKAEKGNIYQNDTMISEVKIASKRSSHVNGFVFKRYVVIIAILHLLPYGPMKSDFIKLWSVSR